MNQMNRDQFIEMCKTGGYAAATIAKNYSKTKLFFTEDDLIVVHRIEENMYKPNNKNKIYAPKDNPLHEPVLRHKTTKRYEEDYE